MKSFNLQIVTPDGIAFSGEVESLLVHTDDGDVEILAGHVDYMASIGTGRARIITGDATRLASCSGGFLTVGRDGVKLVALTFEFKEDIDLARAERAREKAETAVSNSKSDADLLLARAKLERALTRIKVAKL